VLYWKAENPEDFSCENFHTFICCEEQPVEGAENDYYGLPVKEYPGLVKVSNSLLHIVYGMHA